MNTLITFATAVFGLAISPGPDNIFVLIQSMVNGKKYGLATVAGLMTGCLIHTSLVAFGVSAVLESNPKLFFVIKLFGALYLLFLAYKVFQSDAEISLSKEGVKKQSLRSLFVQGFWMNVLNPKVTLFFLALFPKFLFSETMSNVWQFYILGFTFIAVSATVFSSIALLAGNISTLVKTNKNIGHYLKWLQIVVFIGIAVFILFVE